MTDKLAALVLLLACVSSPYLVAALIALGRLAARLEQTETENPQ